MVMATLKERNHVDVAAVKLSDELRKLAPMVVSTPPGYLPDENDPAWPSKSGQAD